MPMVRWVAPLLALLLGGCVRGSPAVPTPPTPSPSIRAAVDAYVAEVAADDRFSGVVLVAKDFVPFASRATGESDRSQGSPNATGTSFNVASLTMLFTAVAIGQLVDQGKVGLDDPLSKYLPSYPKPAGDRITIAMLLAHTAGTGDYQSDPGYLRERETFETLDQLIAAVDTTVPAGAVPGRTVRFSNTGYLLLGAVIERASGRDYYDYVSDEVFARAGVSGGFLRNTVEEHDRRGYAIGYRESGTSNWSLLPVRGTPAGGSYASAPDLLAFHRALARGVLVRPETLRRLVLQAPPSGQTSAGLTSGVFSGDDEGASAAFAMTPNGYTVVVLANVGGVARPMADRILKLVQSGS